MVRWSLAGAVFVGSFSCLVCMSLLWSSTRGFLQSFIPSSIRLVAATTGAMSGSTSASGSREAAGELSAAFVTVPDVEVGEKLASEIVKLKLAACVNIIPGLTSVYEWEGKIEKDKEALLMIKTRRSKIDELSEFVRQNHPYDVAEVISLPMENGNLPYLQWVQKIVPE